MLLGLVLFGCTGKGQAEANGTKYDVSVTVNDSIIQVQNNTAGNATTNATSNSITNTTSSTTNITSNSTNPTSNVSIANPAATYCANMNYSYSIKTNASGQAGFCSKGSLECDEWQLFRGACCLQDADCGSLSCASGSAKCSSQRCACPASNSSSSTSPTNPSNPTNTTAPPSGSQPSPTTYSCTDSDSGQDTSTSGTVSQYVNGSISATYPDSCISSTSVREYYCSGNHSANTSSSCASGYSCSSGRCIANAAPPASTSPATITHADLSKMPSDVTDYSGRTTIYVSTSGNDSASGDQTHPLATIAKALDVVQEGGAIFVQSGTYQTDMLEVSKSNIVLYAQGPVTILPLHPSGTDMFSGFGMDIINPIHDVVIDGFKIANFSRLGIRYGDSGTQKNIILKNLVIEDIGLEGISNGYPGSRSTYMIDGFLIKNVTVQNFNTIGVQCGDEVYPCAKNVLIDGLHVKGKGAAGTGDTSADTLAMVESDNIIVRNSVFEQATGDGMDFKATHVSVLNCTVKDIARNGVKFWQDGELLNSVVHDTGADAALAFDGASGATYRIIGSTIYAHLGALPRSERAAYAMTLGYNNPDNSVTLLIENSTFYEMPGAVWISRGTTPTLKNVTFYDFFRSPFFIYQDHGDYDTAAAINAESWADGVKDTA